MNVQPDKLDAFSPVKVKSSIQIDAPLEACWRVVRQWGRQSWMPLLPDGTGFDTRVLEGFAASEVGAVRNSRFGGASLYEQLVALDDQNHVLKWRLVNHPDTISPFEDAAFINFFTTLTLHSVTVGDGTFAEWEGECYTNPQYAASVTDTFERWYQGGMLSLKEYMRRHQGVLTGEAA